MFFIMKEDIASYPVNVRLFSSGAAVAQTNNISYFIQQYSFEYLAFSGLLDITHIAKCNILIHIVDDIRVNNTVLLVFSENINKSNKILILR